MSGFIASLPPNSAPVVSFIPICDIAESATGNAMEVLPDQDGLMARANQLAERMKQMAPLTIQASLEGLRRLRQAAPLPDDTDLIEKSYVSADFAEGVRAFLEKRKPQWQGK